MNPTHITLYLSNIDFNRFLPLNSNFPTFFFLWISRLKFCYSFLVSVVKWPRTFSYLFRHPKILCDNWYKLCSSLSSNFKVKNVITSFIYLFIHLFIILYFYLPTHCRCRELHLHLITLSDTLGGTPLDEGSALRRNTITSFLHVVSNFPLHCYAGLRWRAAQGGVSPAFTSYCTAFLPTLPTSVAPRVLSRDVSNRVAQNQIILNFEIN